MFDDVLRGLGESAQADQTTAGIRTYAAALRAFYEALAEAGFTAEDALALTLNWRSNLFVQGRGA